MRRQTQSRKQMVRTNKRLWPGMGKIRESVLKRDNYSCQVCGKRQNLIPFHIHHKIPFKAFTSQKFANSLDNLVTLCPDCHRLAEINVKIRNCLSGLRYAMANMAPLLVLCDSRDLGSYSDPHAHLRIYPPQFSSMTQFQAE